VVEVKKARQNQIAREEGYKKARESSLKRELSGSGTTDMARRRREIERRRRLEEEALVKVKTDKG
jgi:hypothetical protein